MTALKQEVINLVDTLPENDMPRLIQFTHRLKVSINAETKIQSRNLKEMRGLEKRKAALLRMERCVSVWEVQKAGCRRF